MPSPKLLAMDPDEGWLIMSEVQGPTLLAALRRGMEGELEMAPWKIIEVGPFEEYPMEI